MPSDYTDENNWKATLHEIIFEADTPAGKTFDILLLFLILLSTAAVILESVTAVRNVIGPYLRIIEWVITLLFTVEYILRLLAVKHPLGYAAVFSVSSICWPFSPPGSAFSLRAPRPLW